MTDDLGAVINRIGQLAATYQRTPREMVAASARSYTTSIRSSIDAATTGGKLRNVGKKGSKVGATYDVQTSSEAHATAIVQGTGPLQIIERDTKAHMIPRTTSSRRLRTASGRLSKKRVDTGRALNGHVPLYINGTWVIGPVKHPGTHGKHPFERGVNAGEALAANAAHEVLVSTISRIFP